LNDEDNYVNSSDEVIDINSLSDQNESESENENENEKSDEILEV